MAGRLDNRVVLVTGGLSGIGAAVCQKLAAEGAKVIAGDLSAQAVELGDDAVTPLRLDVADAGSVQTAVDAIVARHGRLDGLVNSAGIAREQPFLETPVEAFDAIIAVNLRGSFLIGQAAARAMQEGACALVRRAFEEGGIVARQGARQIGPRLLHALA